MGLRSIQDPRKMEMREKCWQKAKDLMAPEKGQLELPAVARVDLKKRMMEKTDRMFPPGEEDKSVLFENIIKGFSYSLPPLKGWMIRHELGLMFPVSSVCLVLGATSGAFVSDAASRLWELPGGAEGMIAFFYFLVPSIYCASIYHSFRERVRQDAVSSFVEWICRSGPAAPSRSE